MVMVAPVIEALLASRTLPRIVPDADCAHRDGAIDNAKNVEIIHVERIYAPYPWLDDYIADAIAVKEN